MATIQNTLTAQVETNLAAMRIAGGYSINMSAGQVKQFRAAPLNPTSVHASIYDYENNAEDDGSLEHELIFTIEITAISKTPAQFRQIMQDFVTAFALIESHASCAYAKLMGLEMDLEHEEKKIWNGTLTAAVFYKSARWTI